MNHLVPVNPSDSSAEFWRRRFIMADAWYKLSVRQKERFFKGTAFFFTALWGGGVCVGAALANYPTFMNIVFYGTGLAVGLCLLRIKNDNAEFRKDMEAIDELFNKTHKGLS